MNSEKHFFTLEKTSGKARAGLLLGAHGPIPTPVFMPVGTRASVKMLSQEDLLELDPKIILGNTYHLYLRPGHDLIERVGGDLHGFMGWPKNILTDSGGFQDYSLSDLVKITEDGVEFRSHIDGEKLFMSPEKSMEIQKGLGSDIVMAFDQCPPLPSTQEDLIKAVDRTIRWAKRCADYPLRPYQKLFGIIQGGLDLKLRTECLKALEEFHFPGLAIGGLSVGEKNEEMNLLLQDFVKLMPEDKPRYLMGVGTPPDLIEAIASGVDMFDCVLPTRNARNGQVITHNGPINIKREQYKEDKGPLDNKCDCRVCRRYSKAYVRHLYNVKEPLAGQLITFHNIHFYLRLMERARQAIMNGVFDEFRQKFYIEYRNQA